MDVFRKTVLLWLVMGICGLFYLNHATASNIFPEDVEPVEINAVIMKVNSSKKYFIVGEEQIYVKNFKVGNAHYKPILFNANGKAVPLDSFMKGERVFVLGLKLPGGGMVAGVVVKLPSGQGHQISEKNREFFIQKARQLQSKPIK